MKFSFKSQEELTKLWFDCFFVFKLVTLQICCFMPLHEQQLWSEAYLRCFFRYGTDVCLKPEMNWLKIDGLFKQQLKNSEASRVKLWTR